MVHGISRAPRGRGTVWEGTMSVWPCARPGRSSRHPPRRRYRETSHRRPSRRAMRCPPRPMASHIAAARLPYRWHACMHARGLHVYIRPYACMQQLALHVLLHLQLPGGVRGVAYIYACMHAAARLPRAPSSSTTRWRTRCGLYICMHACSSSPSTCSFIFNSAIVNGRSSVTCGRSVRLDS